MGADAASSDRAVALAQWLGESGLGLFFAVGAVLLAAVWLSRWALRLRAARLAAGFGGVALAVTVFAVLASALGAGRWVGRLDDAYAGALRAALSPATVDVLGVATHLGDTVTLTLLGIAGALALFAARQRVEALAWVAAVGGQGVVTRALKALFERARPIHDAGIVTSGYSFPSGHTSGAIVTYGMLAWLVLRFAPRRWHTPALLAAAALAWTTGFSRIALQVHHPSDVVAGYASGGLWLAACIVGAEAARRRIARR